MREAKQQVAQDFDIDRRKYTDQLLQVLHLVIKRGTEANKMGAVNSVVAQAMKLARLEG